jgi:hypothetical protein
MSKSRTNKVVCRKCGRGPNECSGYLERVNKLSVDGVWECRPQCGAVLSREDAIISAIRVTPELGLVAEVFSSSGEASDHLLLDLVRPLMFQFDLDVSEGEVNLREEDRK